MDEIAYYAEIEFKQKKGLDLQQLEAFEDKILEAQESLPEEQWIIDEDRMVFDDEEGIAYMVTVDFDTVEQLKETAVPFLKKHMDQDMFEVALHIYKSEYLEVIEGL